MAIQVSPGVHVSEVNLTTSVPAVSTSIGAVSGALNWGPANTPTQITSEVMLASTFGSPDSNTCNVFFTAANFLAYSNNLQVVRAAVTGANNASANGMAQVINNVNDYFSGNTYNSTLGLGTGTNPFTARYPGTLGNSLGVYVWANAACWTANSTNTADPLYAFANFFDYAPGTSPVVSATTGFYPPDQIHILVVDSGGKFTGTQNTVLEKYQALSVLSDATTPNGSTNYYKEVLYRQSKYIYWSGVPQTSKVGWGTKVNSITSNTSITNDGNTMIANISATPSFSGGSLGTATLGDLQNAWSVFSNPQSTTISLCMTADANSALSNYVVHNIAETRTDCIALLSPTLANTLGTAGDSNQPATSIINYVQGMGAYSSYAVMDSGWKYQYDKYNDIYRWIPLNGDIGGLCAYTDNVKDPWWSPAGINRGTVKNVIKLAFNPNQAQRDSLYKAGINPVVTFPGQGTILYGDKMMLNRPSAFDRINVRRLFIVLEQTISAAAESSLFEFNDTFTRSQFVATIDPFLRIVQGRRGIYAYKIVCDTTNNTPAVIDSNSFVGDIYIQPARSTNFIQLNFVATRTGVAFSQVMGQF